MIAWAAWGVVGIAVWVTYARLPAHELYNVSGTGFAAGAGHARSSTGRSRWPRSP
ncbi:MAG TPA: hypothetical protein VH459_09485 [Gaiellales bacterium]